MGRVPMTQVDTETERAAASQMGRRGRVRWTICAMLFLATTINYMDRQVIGLLKPTLENSISLTEINYGYILCHLCQRLLAIHGDSAHPRSESKES